MFSLNEVNLIGNVTHELELKQTPNGTAVVSFSVATNRSVKQQDGEWKDYPEFHRCVCFGKRAETMANRLHKGSKVCIKGRLQTRQWEGQDGIKRNATDIVVTEVVFLEKSASKEKPSTEPVDFESLPDRAEESLDDLPF